MIDDISLIEIELSHLELPDTEDVTSFLAALLNSDCLAKADEFFLKSPETSLLSARGRSILYLLTRYLKPQNILEIGTYKASTSEILTCAIKQNGKGTLTTIDPFGGERVPPILDTWPESLKKHINFMPLSSMDYFMQIARGNISLDLVFIDGDHSYEFALYDLLMAAKHSSPSAVIVMDNVEQTGVYWAGKTFLSLNPDWRELGSSIAEHDKANPFLTMNPSFPDANFLLLQAPDCIKIASLPRSFMISPSNDKGLSGYNLTFRGQQGDGVLHVMTFFRSFYHGGYEGESEQKIQFMSLPVKAGMTALQIEFHEPFITMHDPTISYRTFEIILSWISENVKTLDLISPPVPVTIP